MTDATQPELDELVAMSRYLGQPELELAILGEGNTSARADADSFWLKASGHTLRDIGREGFVRISFERALGLLDGPALGDAETKAALTAAKVDSNQPGHPSVEILLHAVALSLPGINFVGHTHPIVVNSLTCSAGFEAAFAGRLFPDEIVVLGPAPLLIPYVDPGIPLARYVKAAIEGHVDTYGEAPRWMLMQNHGLIAVGKSAQQVQNITAMAVKTCRILLGTFAAGGPHFMSVGDVARIYSRPDEHLRQAVIDRRR
jgi:rhamnose utilization protein RhaD (predicted bifunctional aldolase and dehydrogenase)